MLPKTLDPPDGSATSAQAIAYVPATTIGTNAKLSASLATLLIRCGNSLRFIGPPSCSACKPTSRRTRSALARALELRPDLTNRAAESPHAKYPPLDRRRAAVFG